MTQGFTHTINEVRTLKTLTGYLDIIIKQANKGGIIIVQNRRYYVQEVRRLLSDLNLLKFA